MSMINQPFLSRPHNDQTGIASLLVTMIIMIVISLMVLGFAVVARREQRQATDRQLSTSAFYAAETGVNDAQNAILEFIRNHPAGTPFPADYDNTKGATKTCKYNPTVNSIGKSTDNNAYSCLLVNLTPTSLVFNPITTDQSKAILVQNGSGSNINFLNFSWQNSHSADASIKPDFSKCMASGTFPVLTGWPSQCVAPVLRVDITRGSPIDLNPADTTTLFLYPTAAGGGTVSASGNNGKVIPAFCDTNLGDKNVHGVTKPNECNVSIDVTSPGQTTFFVRVKPIYSDAELTLTANQSSGLVPFSNDQALIDSTGKSQDVLRRIQVRVPITTLDNSPFPDNAVQSTNSICKQFFFLPPSTLESAGPAAPGSVCNNGGGL